MIIYIGSDHRGFELKTNIKEYLNSKNYNVIDIGPHSQESCDYPEIASKLAENMTDNKSASCMGILICGSGIGISIAANRHIGIRCVMARTDEDAKLGRQHNDCNVLALGADFSPDLSIVDTFLNTDYLKLDRYQRRIDMMDD